MTHVALIVKEDGLIYVNEVPEEPKHEHYGLTQDDTEDFWDDAEEHKKALASAKENAVLCADQEQAKDLIWQFHKAFYKVPPGIYPIPDLKWEVKQYFTREGDPDVELAILTLYEQPKEEESQKELIDELIHETFGASLAGREEIAKKFTITRNLKENQ